MLVSRTYICIAAGLLSIAGTALSQDVQRTIVVDESSLTPNSGLRFGWEQVPENNPFREGNWVGMMYGSAIVGTFEDDSRMVGGHAGLGYYLQDNLSINGALGGHYGYRLFNRDQQDEGTYWGTTLEVYLRANTIQWYSWSAFCEAGTGLSYWTKSIPSAGTHWNFILLAGFGLTKQLDDCTSWIVGCRWYHLSNSGIFTPSDQNPGYDGMLLYTGLMFHF